MSAPLLRRTLLLTVLLTLTLAACQNQSVAGPDTGDTGPEVGEQALVGQPASIHCTSEQLEAVDPCQGEDVGSVCTPEDYAVVPWTGDGNTAAPDLTWTYPCNPSSFYVDLWTGAYDYPSDSITAPDPDGGGQTFSWSPDTPLPYQGHLYYYILEATGEVASSKWVATYFWTGPFCTDAPLFGPVQLYPRHERVFVLQEQSTQGSDVDAPGFEWEYHTDWNRQLWHCLTQYEGQVSTDSTFATGVMPILASSPMLEEGGVVGGALEWCHTYYWRVRAYTDAGQGPWSHTHSFDIVPPGGESECGILHVSIGAVAAQNARCRLGPSTAYGVATYVAAGERHPVEGRNADGTWFKLQDLGCYISGELLAFEQQGTPFPGGADVSDLMRTLPILPDPPLPTQPPEEAPSGPACSSTLPEEACGAAGGTWIAAIGCVCP